ncbi:insecticyanin-A-like [Cloeon dipterum]|uniref:insecticyanin-A-like n=1 Tax=Cloeon dipterum TaxID=197152 RepID=UPI00322042DD
MALKVIFLVSVAVAAVNAQIPGIGSCPETKPVAEFDIDRFLGTWYENQRYFSLAEVATRCGKIEYMKSGDKFVAANTVTSSITGVSRVLKGELRVASDSKEGRLAIRYDQVPVVGYNTEYNVVATDYDSYAILWSCSNPVPYLLTAQNAWLMTREAVPDSAVLKIADAEFQKLGISTRFISKVDQTSCNEASAAAAATTAAPVVTTVAANAAVRHAVHDQQVHVKSVPADAEQNLNQVEQKKPVVDSVVAETAPVVDAVKAETEAEPVKVEEPAVVPEPEPVAVTDKVDEVKTVVEEAKPVKE